MFAELVVANSGIACKVGIRPRWLRGACFGGSIGREETLGRCFRQSASSC